jgi:hypothetical protein
MQSIRTRPKREHQGVRLHTILETAELLGDASESHVYRLIATGALRAVDIAAPGSARSKTRVRSDDLADYIDRQTRGTERPSAGVPA